MVFRLDDLPAEEIMAALTADPKDLIEEELLAVNDFIDRIGGFQNALQAAHMLGNLEQQDA